MNDTLKLAGIIVLVIAVIILGPIITIWALNTVFPVLAIKYTFWTWLAMLLLQASLFGRNAK